MIKRLFLKRTWIQPCLTQLKVILFRNCTGENPIFHWFMLLCQKVDQLTNSANFLASGCANTTLFSTRSSWTPHLWRHLKPLYTPSVHYMRSRKLLSQCVWSDIWLDTSTLTVGDQDFRIRTVNFWVLSDVWSDASNTNSVGFPHLYWVWLDVQLNASNTTFPWARSGLPSYYYYQIYHKGRHTQKEKPVHGVSHKK